jgi:hypothetical protein
VTPATATRSPSEKPSTAEPKAWTAPTASCPSVTLGLTGMAPLTMCTSVVQTMAVVVRPTASLGPGSGIGCLTMSTSPISLNTNAFIVAVAILVSATFLSPSPDVL